jgi:hypothetical protein
LGWPGAGVSVLQTVLIALSTGDANRHRRWNLIEVASPGDQGDTLRPRIILIWVADI